MVSILLVNVTLLVTFYKELKIATFDAQLAASLGLMPVLIHYGLMFVTSITAVGAFESVGSILVVALMIAPPSTAFLLTRRLLPMLVMSSLVGFIAVFLGYGASFFFDLSVGGSIVSACGVLFLAALCFSPDKGLVYQLWRFRVQQVDFSMKLLLVQLLQHEGESEDEFERTVRNMIVHMKWTKIFSEKVVSHGVRLNTISRQGRILGLTSYGREVAKQVMVFKGG